MHKQSVDIRYFSNYPNNLLYFFFELFVFKLNKYFSIFSDTQQVLCVITVNCALNTLSCLLVYKTAARLTRKLYAFFGFFLENIRFSCGASAQFCGAYAHRLQGRCVMWRRLSAFCWRE